MKRYLVFKFSGNEAFAYIVEAENAEYAMTLFFGASKCIGKFKSEKLYGESGFAIELDGEEYAVSDAIQPLRWISNAVQIMQNNN